MVIGHEASGQVLALGSNVKHLKIGEYRLLTVKPLKCRYFAIAKFNTDKNVYFTVIRKIK